MPYSEIEATLQKGLNLSRRPVAISFLDYEPSSVEKFTGVVPSGCTFWKLAADGRTFYTVSSDHYNCAIGSYTHRIELPPERADELTSTLRFMSEIGYVSEEEVP